MIFWVYFVIAIEQKVQKRKKPKNLIASFFEKIAQNLKKNFSHLKSVLFWKAIPKFYIVFLTK